MARTPYAGGMPDFAYTVTGGSGSDSTVMRVAAGRQASVYMPDGTTRVTDLQSATGVAITVVTANSSGGFDRFYGPDGYDGKLLLADAAVSSPTDFVDVYPADLTDRVVALEDAPSSGGGAGTVTSVAAVAPDGTGDIPLADLQAALDVVLSVAGVGADVDGDVSASSLATALSVLQSSTLTTKGDIFARTSTGVVRLPVGADGTRLTADSTTTFGLAWSAAGTSATTPRFVYRGSTGTWPARPDSDSTKPVWWIDGTNTTPTDPGGKINGADFQIGPA
jgi:hypothetical protein